MTDNAQHIIDSIERAFAGVRLEDGLSIREASVIDHYGSDEERRQAREQDEHEDWRRVPNEVIGSHSASLAYFDAKAMRFYLPAFMRFTLGHYRDSDSASICCTIFALGEDHEKFSLLSPDQRQAVVEFLEFMASQEVLRDERADARHALDQLWMAGERL